MSQPLEMNPKVLIEFLSFFSPILLATIITCYSFVFQNVKGFVYLGFLLAACILRHITYSTGSTTTTETGSIELPNKCSAIQFSKYGNVTFSVFVFAFTIFYIATPMFVQNTYNFAILIPLIIYFFMDVFVKRINQCVSSITDFVLNLLCGAALGALFVVCMYSGGSSVYLFTSDVGDDNSSNTSSTSSTPKKCKLIPVVS